ncbi:MAG: glycosyltransferase family 4 protein [Proteobacteria bacterium]|nr:glycosyltransferase family 4 protein [Pseudomonadota bacterium]
MLTVTHFYEAHGGGIERVAGNLCREFAAMGLETAWAASDQDAVPLNGVVAVPLRSFDPVERLTGLPMTIPGWRSIRELAREIARCDAVIIHDALYASSILAMLIARRARKRTVLVQHIAAIPFSSRLLRGVMRLAGALVTRPMLRAADAVVFISDTVRAELIGTSGWRDWRLAFNGVDRAIFHRTSTDVGEPGLPRRWPQDKTRVLFVGRYVDKKGLAVLRALAEYRQDLALLLVGTGPRQPGEWGLSNVHDLGPQTQTALADLYRSADLLLLPSVGEGFPLVIQEAMASGLPVICGQPADRGDPNAARWIKGVPIDLADPQGSALRCSQAIDSARLSTAERAEMADYAAATYDWHKMAETLIAAARGTDGQG